MARYLMHAERRAGDACAVKWFDLGDEEDVALAAAGAVAKGLGLQRRDSPFVADLEADPLAQWSGSWSDPTLPRNGKRSISVEVAVVEVVELDLTVFVDELDVWRNANR